MSQQQQSEQPPQQSQQPNWFFVLIVTVIVGGIVNILVNHFDAIAAFIVGLFSQVHLPPLQGSPAFVTLNILSGIVTSLASVLILLRALLTLKGYQRRLMEQLRLLSRSNEQVEEHTWQITKQTNQIVEHTQQVEEKIKLLTERNQQLEERNQQLEEQLAKQQRKKGSPTSKQ